MSISSRHLCESCSWTPDVGRLIRLGQPLHGVQSILENSTVIQKARVRMVVCRSLRPALRTQSEYESHCFAPDKIAWVPLVSDC